MNEEKTTSLNLSEKDLTPEHALLLAAKLQVWMRLYFVLASCVQCTFDGASCILVVFSLSRAL